jgi:hypothetical protein
MSQFLTGVADTDFQILLNLALVRQINMHKDYVKMKTSGIKNSWSILAQKYSIIVL